MQKREQSPGRTKSLRAKSPKRGMIYLITCTLFVHWVYPKKLFLMKTSAWITAMIFILGSCTGPGDKKSDLSDVPVMSGNQPAAIDSLVKQLKRTDLQDTTRALSMMRLGTEYETVDTTLSDQTYQAALAFAESKQLHYHRGLIYHNRAFLHRDLYHFDKALLYLDSAVYYMMRGDHPRRDINIGRTWAIAATVWRDKGDQKKGVEYSYKAIRQYEKIGAVEPLITTYVDLANLYKQMNEFEKEEECGRKALEAARKTGLNKDYFASYYCIGLALTMQNKYKKAAGYLDSAAVYYSEKYKYPLLTSYHLVRGLNDMNLAESLEQKDPARLDSAAWNMDRVIDLAEKNGDNFGRIQGLLQKGRILMLKKKFPEAEALVMEAEKEIKKGAEHSHLEILLDYQSRLYEEWGKDAKALAYYKEYKQLADSMASERNKQFSSQLEVEFETEKKETQIRLQQASIRQKNILNYVFAGSTVLVLLLTFFIYRTYKQKRKLQQQRIQELETEKQLLATQSLLKGQEDERSRLAKDLHDGLGGLLSGVKLQLGSMKGNLILTEEHGRIFNNALIKLDESISEMRRVAHNMMPEALMNLGLQHALEDYCESLSASQSFRIETAFYGLEQRLEPSVEVVVYRIVQELINNAVKHSGATNILAQVMRQNNHLTITVEDNGKGFEKTQLEKVKTAGLHNIQSRVNYLRGNMDIQSAPGKGTSVHIECPIDAPPQ